MIRRTARRSTVSQNPGCKLDKPADVKRRNNEAANRRWQACVIRRSQGRIIAAPARPVQSNAENARVELQAGPWPGEAQSLSGLAE